MSSAWSQRFVLEEGLDFLNHGSFGACPRAVLDHQQALREELERQPMSFMVRRLQPRLDEARARLAAFVGASPADLVFVNNATTGVNAVLRSLELQAGDELLTTSHAYNACANALRFVAGRAGATVKVIELPFPLKDPAEVVERVLDAVSDRSRLLLIDHITSPTGLVLPIEAIVPELERRGIAVLVDGAHGPGMVELDLPALGASYYTGNWHKWCCAPKGAAFLWVREDRRREVRPVVISHGASLEAAGLDRFHPEFDWVGTDDPTAWLSAAEALRFLEATVEGGWPAIRARNRALCLEARDLLCEALEIERTAPDAMIGTLAALPLPDRPRPEARPHLDLDPLQEVLLADHRIEVPIVPFPAPLGRLVRISAHLYNHRAQYQRLADALPAALEKVDSRA
ncbi:MAG: aminotransferase class V-fold PLP-dependent enzyme [Deltaproteobacteria bacterium]|nr:aminotransferase class V-fold PLP-dependent enzyme [Deltaproteobacteria bacterium]